MHARKGKTDQKCLENRGRRTTLDSNPVIFYLISEMLLKRTNGIRLPGNFTKIHKENISAKESIAAKDGSVP